jgi:hypothetical protein
MYLVSSWYDPAILAGPGQEHYEEANMEKENALESGSAENPFYWLPVAFDPNKYYGSREKVRIALQTIADRDPGSFELLGLPGMGKSTLLRYLAHPQGALARHREWIPEAFAREPQRVFPILVEYRRLPTGMKPFTYLAQRFLEEYPVYRERSNLSDLPEPEYRPAPEGADNALDYLETKLLALQGQHIRPVLLLDDFDLPFKDLSPEQTTRMRPWRDGVSFILGTERPLHLINQRAAGSPFFQTLSLERLGGLTRPESHRLIEEPAQLAGRCFPPEDIAFVLENAGGHPYLLILAGRALWELRQRLELLEQGDHPLNKAQQAVLRGRLLDDFTLTFQLYWNRLESYEQGALQLLAQGKPADLGEAHDMALASLEQKGLVQLQPDGSYRLFSPLFRVPGKYIPPAPPVGARALELTELEERLYQFLREQAGQACSFTEIAQALWGAGADADQKQVHGRIQVSVSRLRKKLQEANQGDILPMRGLGYRLVE